MAHNLEQYNNRASMFYTGQVPWHQLGKQLANPATAAEAMEAARLDFTVAKVPLAAVLNDPQQIVTVPERFATIRTDTNKVLGIVGNRYTVVQNRDAFNFFDPLVDRDEAIYHTAGVLGYGEKMWLLAKLPDYIKIGKSNDPIEKYVLLYGSHDGSSPVRIKLTPIRVVCNNTLTTALSGLEQEIRIRHTFAAADRLQEAYKILELSNNLYAQLDSIFNKMAETKISTEDSKRYYESLIPNKDESDKSNSLSKQAAVRNQLMNIYNNTPDSEMHKGTVFGVYNAVTELTDHYTARKKCSANSHLEKIWFGGGGEQLKRKAYVLAEKMIT